MFSYSHTFFQLSVLHYLSHIRDKFTATSGVRLWVRMSTQICGGKYDKFHSLLEPFEPLHDRLWLLTYENTRLVPVRHRFSPSLEAFFCLPFLRYWCHEQFFSRCKRFPNGTVTINREGLPAPTSFKNNVRIREQIFYSTLNSELPLGMSQLALWFFSIFPIPVGKEDLHVGVGITWVLTAQVIRCWCMKWFQLRPVEVLGPMWKKFVGLGRVSAWRSVFVACGLIIIETFHCILLYFLPY